MTKAARVWTWIMMGWTVVAVLLAVATARRSGVGVAIFRTVVGNFMIWVAGLLIEYGYRKLRRQ